MHAGQWHSAHVATPPRHVTVPCKPSARGAHASPMAAQPDSMQAQTAENSTEQAPTDSPHANSWGLGWALTNAAKTLMQHARNEAADMGHTSIQPAHVLLAALAIGAQGVGEGQSGTASAGAAGHAACCIDLYEALMPALRTKDGVPLTLQGLRDAVKPALDGTAAAPGAGTPAESSAGHWVSEPLCALLLQATKLAGMACHMRARCMRHDSWSVIHCFTCL